jgi:ATP-dependent RNA helicase DDX52/ROK1
MAKLDNSMFKSLTCGVTFDKSKFKAKLRSDLNKPKVSKTYELVEDYAKLTTEPLKKKKLSEAYVNHKKSEEINKLRKVYNINVKGCEEKIKPVQTFDELFNSYPFNDALKTNIMSYKFSNLTPVQMQVLPVFLKRISLKVVANTGSGKTFAFAVPLIQIISENIENSTLLADQIQSIILVPTRELAMQILSVTSKLCYGTGVRCHIIKSTSENHMKNFHKKKTNILITTPLKLVHFIKAKAMRMDNVKWIIIDEVDKLFEESNHGFEDDLNLILTTCNNDDRKFALFSATTTKEMTPFVHENLKNFTTVNISPNVPSSSVKQELLFVGTESAKIMTIRNIFNEGVLPPILIFLQSKDRAKQLYSELLYDGLRVEIIHSDRSQKEREDIWILICTELMSRGIDFYEVNMVINFDLPTSSNSYIHRVGRCGRANRTGRAITLYTSDDKKGILREIAQLVQKSGSHVEEFLLQLKKSSKKERTALLKKAPRRKRVGSQIEPQKKIKSWKKNMKLKKKLKIMSKEKETVE